MIPNLYKLNSETSEIDGVYRFQIDFPPFDGLKFVCIYLFKVDNHKILIDAGLNFPDWKKIFFAELKNLNVSFKEIDYLIITHEHPDHIGLMKTIKRKNPNIQILMHNITHELIKWLSNPDNIDQIRSAANALSIRTKKFGVSEKQTKRIFQYMSSMHNLVQYCKPDKILNDYDEISFDTTNLKIIWTPGHSPGHICVFDEKSRFLFSGDHVLSRITPHIGNFLINPSLEKDYDFSNILHHYLTSLDRIDTLDSKLIFPAHQEVIYNPHEQIKSIKEHHKNRLLEISKLIEKKPLTPYGISQIHFGEDLSEMNTFLALSEVLSHLNYLENQNKIRRFEKSNKIYFLKEN